MADKIDTWERLIAAIRARWPITGEARDSITVGAGARSLRFDRLDVAAFPGSAFVAVRFVLCRRELLAEASALRINSALALGALTSRGDVYELQHVVDLAELSIDQLEYRLGFLAKLVDSLRQVHAPRAAIDGDAYAMFTD